ASRDRRRESEQRDHRDQGARREHAGGQRDGVPTAVDATLDAGDVERPDEAREEHQEVPAELTSAQTRGVQFRREDDHPEEADQEPRVLLTAHGLPEEKDHEDRDEHDVHVDEEGRLRRGREEDAFILEIESDRVDGPEDPYERLSEDAAVESTHRGEDEQPEGGAQGHPGEGEEQWIDGVDRELAPGERGAPEDAREEDQAEIPSTRGHRTARGSDGPYAFRRRTSASPGRPL